MNDETTPPGDDTSSSLRDAVGGRVGQEDAEPGDDTSVDVEGPVCADDGEEGRDAEAQHAEAGAQDAEAGDRRADTGDQAGARASSFSGYLLRIFGSRAFLRLWVAEVISATGDWLGLFATITLAARISEGSEGVSIGIVLASRIAPGFFLATAAGVFIDRLNRKHVMVVCDLGRAVVLMTLPFVDTLVWLVIASFVLELFTMMWQPAKEAAVPDLVPRRKLTSANSLNFIAAYATFPVAAGMAALLPKIAELIADSSSVGSSQSSISRVLFNEEGLAFFVDALSFLVAAMIVIRIPIAHHVEPKKRTALRKALDLGGTFRELREGWRLIAADPIVRAVNIGLATGLMGGGMLVPMGAIFVDKVVDGTSLSFNQNLPLNTNFNEDFSLVLLCLGVGMAIGVVGASLLESRINHSKVFAVSLWGAGLSLFMAATFSQMSLVLPFVVLLGLLAGPVYVLGFTMLHAHVEHDIRGRVFSALFVLMRLCLLIALAVAPILSDRIDRLSAAWWDSEVTVLGVSLYIPGVRITMWLAALIIAAAGVLSAWSLQPAPGRRRRERL